MIVDKKTIRSILLIVFCAILFFFLLWYFPSFWKAVWNIVGLLMPLLIGLCIAFVLKPLTMLPEDELELPSAFTVTNIRFEKAP